LNKKGKNVIRYEYKTDLSQSKRSWTDNTNCLCKLI